MIQKYRGDETNALPAEMIEPYRWWFEFLKSATRDSEIDVDEQLYKSWGDVSGIKFNDWWKNHWRELFSVRSKVSVLEPGTKLSFDKDAISLSIPIGLTKRDVVKQVSEIVDAIKEKRSVTSTFILSEGAQQSFVKKRNSIRRYLRFYNFWLDHQHLSKQKRIEQASRDFVKWTRSIEAKKNSGSKREIAKANHPYTRYVEYLDDRDAGSRTTQKSHAYDIEDCKRQIRRHLTKARKLASNVAKGEFPGKYA